MPSVARKLWPVLLGLAIFIAVSAVVRTQIDVFAGLLEGKTDIAGMALYVLIGIATVLIPFGSLVPFMPIAVALWGWFVTALLTLVAWVLGSQLIFELSRAFGKPFAEKFVAGDRLKGVRRLIGDRNLLHQILIRWIVRGDIVSYAFGIFTNVGRKEFLLITIVGVAPGAFTYSYFGSLPIAYQIGLAVTGVTLFATYMIVHAKRPQWLRALKLDVPEADIE